MPVDTRLTYEDYCRLPNDGKRYEIIEGELFVSPSRSRAHQAFLTNLVYYLVQFVKNHGLGKVYVAPFDVMFSRFDVVEPDLLYVSEARTAIVSEKNVQGAPDLVVEALSESTAQMDRTTKLKLYARYGVQEYWIIDPVEITSEVYRVHTEGLDLVERLARADAISSPLFPGFALPLERLSE